MLNAGVMSHALVMALFQDAAAAGGAARALRGLGIPRERVSIVARSHAMGGGRATKTPPRRAARMTGKAELASGGLTKG